MMLPDPNKRKSTVVSDNGASVVYVDDFEGAQRYISLGMNPNQWTHSSQPVDEFLGMDDTTRAKYRAKMFWYKKFIPYIPITDPYPEQNNISGRNNIAPLEIFFSSKKRFIFSRSFDSGTGFPYSTPSIKN
jgi:cell surface protein SprA